MMSFLFTALVAGCAAPADHPALQQAGAAVERARSAPRVRALAAVELDRAEVALERARAAVRADAPPNQVEHLAYVVSQQAARAEARAAEQVARGEIEKLQRALGQVLAHGRVEQNQRTHAPARERGLGRVRLAQDQEAPASSAQPDQETRAPLEKEQIQRTGLAEARQASAPLEHDQPARTGVAEDQHTGASLEGDQQARTPLEQDQPTRIGSAGSQQTVAPLQGDQQASAPVEGVQQGSASVQGDRQAGAPLEADEREPPSVEEDQQARTAESDDGAAIVGTMPQDITLSLAQLPFEGAEPTDVTIEQLTALAERLLREPGPSVSIEVDFELPDPEARTMMERRVEVVRAILLQRGIAPARLVVRAAGDGPAEPPAIPSFVEPPD